MLYGLEQGESEKWVLEQAYRLRMPIPEKFLNAPELTAGLGLFYAAFMDLTSCRALGYGVLGPIDWLTINEYCKANKIKGIQREDTFFFISKMDEVYLKWTNSKRPDHGKRVPETGE